MLLVLVLLQLEPVPLPSWLKPYLVPLMLVLALLLLLLVLLLVLVSLLLLLILLLLKSVLLLLSLMLLLVLELLLLQLILLLLKSVIPDIDCPERGAPVVGRFRAIGPDSFRYLLSWFLGKRDSCTRQRTEFIRSAKLR